MAFGAGDDEVLVIMGLLIMMKLVLIVLPEIVMIMMIVATFIFLLNILPMPIKPIIKMCPGHH